MTDPLLRNDITSPFVITDPLLCDNIMSYILEIVAFERRDEALTDFPHYPDFRWIPHAPTRRRFEEFNKYEYLPSKIGDDGCCIKDEHSSTKIFDFLIPTDAKHYYSSGTADSVGGFGHLGVFMHYVGVSGLRPDLAHCPAIEREHAYAPAAILGAVTGGHVHLLEQLALTPPDKFAFHDLLFSHACIQQLSIGTFHYSPESVDYDVFTLLLYGAFDSRLIHVVKWLINWFLYFSDKDELSSTYHFVYRIWYEEQITDLGYTNSPITQMFALSEFIDTLTPLFIFD